MHLSVTKAKLVTAIPFDRFRSLKCLVRVSELGDCHYRIPREILGRNDSASHLSSRSKINIFVFGHVTHKGVT